MINLHTNIQLPAALKDTQMHSELNMLNLRRCVVPQGDVNDPHALVLMKGCGQNWDFRSKLYTPHRVTTLLVERPGTISGHFRCFCFWFF